MPTGLPAKCLNPACGHVFEKRNVFGGSGAVIKIGGGEATCPLCGSPAAFGAGAYQLEQGALRLKDGPTLTREMIAQLEAIALKAQQSDLAAADVVDEVAGVSPELADKLRPFGLTAEQIIRLLFAIARPLLTELDLVQFVRDMIG